MSEQQPEFVEPAQEPPGAPESVTEPPEAPEPPDEPVEPENGGEEPDDTQEAVPITVEHRSPEQIEAAQASWDRERTRHMNELKKRDEIRYNDTVACPLCDGHGLIYPVLPEPEQTARREFINAALGAAAPKEYRKHPTEARCEVCDGLGQLESGSQVEGQMLLNCTACGATGHRAYGTPPNMTTSSAPAPAYVTGPTHELAYSTVPMAEQVRIGRDAWQRDPGDPHYGVPPIPTNQTPQFAGTP